MPLNNQIAKLIGGNYFNQLDMMGQNMLEGLVILNGIRLGARIHAPLKASQREDTKVVFMILIWQQHPQRGPLTGQHGHDWK